MMMTLVGMPQPVIARVHGIATAAGCQLVAMCDLAVAADGGEVRRLRREPRPVLLDALGAAGRAMGRKQAMEMLLTGDFIDAAEAQRRGLVNRVVPLDQLDAEVKKLTDSICAKSPWRWRWASRCSTSRSKWGWTAPTSWPPKPWPAT
jgi:enoyl-CoA hydratase/carnithine racemase